MNREVRAWEDDGRPSLVAHLLWWCWKPLLGTLYPQTANDQNPKNGV